jgi:dipeptidyl aminopeptidase/acylaminoacyl peptidase
MALKGANGNLNKEENFPFERFASRRIYYAFDFLPGTNGILYSSSTSGQFNLWRQSPPIVSKNGKRSVAGPAKQLTGFDEWSVRYIAPEPTHGRFTLVFADKDGDENYQLFLVDNEDGWQRSLVNKEGVRNTFGLGCLSPNGKFAAYSTNERSPRYLDIVLTNVATGETRNVFSSEASYGFGEWSPDGRKCTVMEIKDKTDDNNLLLLDTKTGKSRLLTPHKDRAVYQPCSWDKKGTGFYVVTNEGHEFQGLGYLDPEKSEGSRLKWIETPDYDIEDAALAPNEKTLAWVSNQEGYSVIHLKDLTSGKVRTIKTRGWVFGGWFENTRLIKFSRDSKKLMFLLSTATNPQELFVVSAPEREMTQYTFGFVGNVPEKIMSEPELIHYDSFDRKIPAFLYKPKSMAKKNRMPAVLSIHGGPEAQERPFYSYAGLYQYLLSKGIAVLAPNIRGSTGYGKSYQNLIHHDWGGGELKDIEYAAKYLHSLDWVDKNRIGVFGGSFGGFATLEAATRLPDYWAAAVDIFGPSNLVTAAKSVPEFWMPMIKDWLGDPVTETEFLLSRSPITYISNLKCPILIIQGANDPRVVKNESDQVVEKLRSMGRGVEYVVFEDEGHGFTKRKNEFIAWKKSSEFLLKHLLRGEKKKEEIRTLIAA